ncbi:LytR/AlgR family response regulator transcription factor [Hymenobacter weizhouensis]|uniref:LytR/AlgR family response regulator transcription factor n=1 Tax=Hymenobacter sp. YIM 151500-1 TaxID=2987689 RepID=UPI0022274E1C|nr:response regulator [Hymenobacter sp. YIM 151500-1]UYZ62147.1 response regulator [Hymenobacter sp. YIM 151500-1]
MPSHKILIVEDESTIARHLSRVLELLGHRVTGIAGRVSEALESLHQERPDLVLLDIKLRGELDGIDLATRLRSEYHLPFVFVTSQADARTVERAKLTRPHGYLIKPFDENDIFVAVELALSVADDASLADPMSSSSKEEKVEDSLFLRYRKQLVKVRFTDLCWVSSDRNYTTLHATSGKYTMNYSLKYVEEHLPKSDFLRVHKSYIVAISRITAFNFNDNYVVVDGNEIPVGRVYQPTLVSRFNLLSDE